MSKNREQTAILVMAVLIIIIILGGLALLFWSMLAAPTVRTVITVVPPTPLSTVTPTESADKRATPTAIPTATFLPSTEPTPSYVARAVIIWSHMDEAGRCRQARIGREWLDVRSCDNSNSAIYPLSTERQNELLQFASTFTRFEGNTKAGRVEFNGTSGLYAAPAEERMIATWAALVVREAESGQTPAMLVLEWQPSQNGQCQKMQVTLTGLATAFSCDSEVVVELAQQRLVPEKVAQLYDWYDRLGHVSASDFTFFGEGSSTLSDADKQAIERFAEGLFSVLSLSAVADNVDEIEPLAQAAEIRFASWSPDSRWLAYWLSTAEDLERRENPIQPPPATLHFANPETGENCAMAEYYGDTRNIGLTWAEDNRAVVHRAEGAVIGLPCQADSFTIYTEPERVPVTTPAAEPNLSPDGRYHIQTEILTEAENVFSLRTTMMDVAGGRVLYTVEWQSYGYVDGCCLAQWISPSQYLISETKQRPLLIDAEQGVLDVPLDIFNVRPLPPDPEGNLTLYHALGLPAAARDQFHLLLTLRGNFNETFPAEMLYHPERGLVETLPAGWHVWNFTAGSEWLYLSEEVVTVEPLPGGGRNTGYNLWARPLEEVEGEWLLVAPAMDSISWNEAQSETAFIQNETMVVWQTFPEGEPLGRWRTNPYWIHVSSFSPDGRYLVTVGNLPGLPDYALFVHKRDAY